MNIITREANVNALRQVESLDTLLFEGEVNAHMFRIKPVEGIDFTGATIVGTFLRADNQRVQVETGAVVDGNAEITLTAGCYAVPGRYRWTIYMVTADETACIYAACGTVQSTQGSGTAGDTEPIIEPTAPDLTPITDRLTAVEGRYWGEFGASLTAGGVTITQEGPYITLNGTSTGAYVKMDGGLTAGTFSALTSMDQAGRFAAGSAPRISFSSVSGSYTEEQSDGITPSSPYGPFAIRIVSTDSGFNNTTLSPRGFNAFGAVSIDAGTFGLILILTANYTFDHYRVYVAAEDTNLYHAESERLINKITALEARVAALEG